MEVVIEAANFPANEEAAFLEKTSSMNRLNWAGTSMKYTGVAKSTASADSTDAITRENSSVFASMAAIRWPTSSITTVWAGYASSRKRTYCIVMLSRPLGLPFSTQIFMRVSCCQESIFGISGDQEISCYHVDTL